MHIGMLSSCPATSPPLRISPAKNRGQYVGVASLLRDPRPCPSLPHHHQPLLAAATQELVDWSNLPDAKSKTLEEFRQLREAVRSEVQALITQKGWSK